jgi:hypothetical protein
VFQHGMMQCNFNKDNKMTSAEMVFDVMGFMQQLQVIVISTLMYRHHVCISNRYDDISEHLALVQRTVSCLTRWRWLCSLRGKPELSCATLLRITQPFTLTKRGR